MYTCINVKLGLKINVVALWKIISSFCFSSKLHLQNILIDRKLQNMKRTKGRSERIEVKQQKIAWLGIAAFVHKTKVVGETSKLVNHTERIL